MGPEAAKLFVAANTLRILGSISMFVYTPLILAGFRSHNGILLTCGWLIFISAGVAIATSFVKQHQYYVAASRTLGIELGIRQRTYVPRSSEKYEQWCRQHGLEPYAADPKH